ncbi:tetratricopeptide repeat-containing protein kinase family protein [Oceanicoccus sagamiensis]|uniref:Tetratricopeptide repeat protein n=1 Tax=Oceanicoccus sagamiensis TaxID=716816 RepID=A0A1X9NEJ9_9GAMM|nr:tetratricopeptide repeat-containing protein kinase family protein [Oceanicoccus sagamiensis]ARN73367.1 hypothetical protein BST96_04130 [Oceanicoccus sagamiensis]
MTDFYTHVDNYKALAIQKDYDGACAYFIEHLDKPTVMGINEPCLMRAELLEMLFPDGVENPTGLKNPQHDIFVLAALPITYGLTGGYPGKAIGLYERHAAVCKQEGAMEPLAEAMGNHSKALRQTGRFREAEIVALQGLDLQRQVGKRMKEAVNLYWVGTGFAHRGVTTGAPFEAMDRAIRIFQKLLADQSEAVTNTFKGQSAIWFGNYDEAEGYHTRAWELSKAREGTDFPDQQTVTKVLSASSRMLGEIEMLRGNYDKALEWLEITEIQAARMDFGEEILPHFRVMAELERRRGNFDQAREWLTKSWERAERGPYRLYNVDSYNILAEVEDSCGNTEAAIKAAQTAYQLAWCDGPPYAYQRGLDDAKAKIESLGGAVPTMPDYDDSKFEPVPDVLINPQDEYFD